MVLLLAWPVRAQEAPTLANLEISLWPEFDRPEVLVIYRGTFAADTPLPISVEIRIPARAGQPTAVAYVADGERLNQEHTVREEGDWIVVSFELPTPSFQLEYYDPLSTDGTGRREYAFTYRADYSLTALSLDVQVPPTAQAFALDPPADSVVQEGDGLTYHLVQRGPLAAGDAQEWAFAYEKDNSDLTVSAFVQPEAPAPTAQAPLEAAGNSTVWVFLVAFAALVAVGAGAFWLGRQTHPGAEAVAPPRRPKRRGSGRSYQALGQRPANVSTAEPLFCHKCGMQLRSDSEFCHKCGAPVRR